MRIVDVVASVALLAVLGGLALHLRGGLPSLDGHPAVLDGTARVVDGDTLVLAGTRVRLAGMDAPEIDQVCTANGAAVRCGETARDALRALTHARPVSCRLSGRDRFGRALGRCSAGGEDLGSVMVLRGLAVAFGAYGREEHAARLAGAGLWAGSFDRPSEWRRAHPRAPLETGSVELPR